MNKDMPRKASILLVEDDKSILEGIADLLWLELDKLGYEPDVKMAEHGAAALKLMNQFLPDLIISDIMMPVMGGYDFKEQVQSNPAWVHIPFFFLTARSDKNAISEGRRAGVERYITKPFNTNELIGQVITQLELNQQRRQLHQEKFEGLKRDFTWMINHELRTPLTYVSAYYELLKDSVEHLDSQGYYEESLRGIQGGCLRLSRLIENFIKVIDLRTGQKEKEFRTKVQVIDYFAALLRSTVEAHQGDAAAAHITLHHDIPHQLPALWGDPDSLKEIIERLLDNAIKFTRVKAGSDKMITVSASVHQGEPRTELIIKVTDTGIGFPGFARDQIFDLFYQYNRTHLEQQGAGTGLTIVKGLVELHRGRIEAESEENVGSTFTITLPIYQIHHPIFTADPQPNKRRVTILVLEDDPHLLEGITDVLELPYAMPYQFQVLQAINGQDGLKQLAKNKPDLIISDIMMPIIDGYQFYERVRQNPNWLHIPFIFLTARGEAKDIYKGNILGAEDYITKPYDNDDLMNRVVARLDRYFQQQYSIQTNIDEWKKVILYLLQPEIATPILSVSTYSQTLAERFQAVTNEDELREPLLGIQAGSQQLTQLIEDFIALTELKTGETAKAFAKLSSATDELAYWLYETAQTLMPEVVASGSTMTLPQLDMTPPVLAEISLCRRLFHHVLRCGLTLNQLHRGRALNLNLQTTATTVIVNLSLPQVLLPLGEQAVINTLFEHNDQQLLRQSVYGPSLAIVKGLTDLHNGQVKLDQDESGCTISICFPIVHDQTESDT